MKKTFRLQTLDFRLPKGFTLLEVILAITILTIAVGGSFALISQTIAAVSVIQSKLIASYLVQEGMEIVKNIRDTNWLKNQPWDQNLEEENYEVDYLTALLPDPLLCLPVCDYDDLELLGIDHDGFYGYNYFPENKTIFKRKITISDKADLDGDSQFDKLKVSVEVQWEERGKIHSIVAQEYLYNWAK